MNIIVTGGAGFIGSNFVQHMVNKYPDYEIINLDLLTYAGNLENLKPVEDKPNYRFIKGDIADRAFIFKLFEEEKPDVVVNFAAESHVDRSIEDPGVFLQTNIIGTATMMDACRKYGIQRYHQVSTDEVYGDLALDDPARFTEETPYRPSSRTAPLRHRPTCWCARGSAPTECVPPSRTARTTTARASTSRSSSRARSPTCSPASARSSTETA